MKCCLGYQGHMAMKAVMPMYGKACQNLHLRNQRVNSLAALIEALGPCAHQNLF